MQPNAMTTWDRTVPFNAGLGQSHDARPQATSWPDPDRSILSDGRRSPPTLPLRIFGPWAQWIVDTAELKSAPPDFVAAGLIACAAAAIGNARAVSPWAGWEEPSALWMGLVGDPSSGKSQALAPFISIMQEIEIEQAEDHKVDIRQFETSREAAACRRKAWESEVRAAVSEGINPPEMPVDAVAPIEPARPRLILSDATSEAVAHVLTGNPKGLLVLRDEIAGWICGFDRYSKGGGDRAFYLEAFGARPYVIDRKNAEQPIIIERLLVSIVGGIQPDKLSSLFMSGDDDGLTGRFLLTWPDPVPPKRPNKSEDLTRLSTAIESLRSIGFAEGQKPVVLSLTDDAAALFDEWRQVNFKASQNKTGRLAAHCGKLPGILLRLSLLLEHLWRDGPASISKQAIAAAAALIDDYFLPMAERCYGDASRPVEHRNAATMARWIAETRPQTINACDLRRNVRLPGLSDAIAIEAAIKELVDAGWLKPAPSREGASPGRQRADFTINPKIWGA